MPEATGVVEALVPTRPSSGACLVDRWDADRLCLGWRYLRLRRGRVRPSATGDDGSAARSVRRRGRPTARRSSTSTLDDTPRRSVRSRRRRRSGVCRRLAASPSESPRTMSPTLQPDIGRDGTMADWQARRDLGDGSRDGRSTNAIDPIDAHDVDPRGLNPRWSPDGSELASSTLRPKSAHDIRSGRRTPDVTSRSRRFTSSTSRPEATPSSGHASPPSGTQCRGRRTGKRCWSTGTTASRMARAAPARRRRSSRLIRLGRTVPAT